MSIFKGAFLLKIIVRSKGILICENYFKRSLYFCTVSLLDSTRCMEYIRSNCFKYDVLGPIVIQLETLSSIYICLKTELEDTFKKQMQEFFCVVRL